MIRKMVLSAMLCAMAALSLASMAGATVKGNGTNVANGTAIGTTSGTDGIVGSATLTTNLGNIVCSTGGFAGTIANNSTTATGTLTSGSAGLSFNTCSSWFGVSSCSQKTGTSGSVSQTGTTITVSNTVVICNSGLGTCAYATASGGTSASFSNTASTATFSSASVVYDAANSSLGSGTCGSTASFDATFGTVEVLSGPLTGALVTVS